ncbi:MAG: hypothetical protein WBB08_04350 [Halobacteriota archaeon]
MENHNDWYIDIVKEIGRHKDKFSKRDYKKYKLDLLLRMAKRVASFSADCVECQNFQGEIKKLAEDLGNLVQASKEERKSYFKMINSILKHLQERHKLITEGENFGIWTGIGIAIGGGMGIVFGVGSDNIGIGIPIGAGIGIAIGSAIGSYMDAKAKKEGMVI